MIQLECLTKNRDCLVAVPDIEDKKSTMREQWYSGPVLFVVLHLFQYISQVRYLPHNKSEKRDMNKQAAWTLETEQVHQKNRAYGSF